MKKIKNKRMLILYIGYIWTKTLLGLTFYPYRYINSTVRRPILVPVVFSPFIGIFLLMIAAKIGSFFININGFKRDVVAVFLSTTLLSIVFWQLLLLYLFAVFLFTIRGKR